jgi:hypothetical protein
MEQYNWLHVGFFTGHGLYYGQDFSNEELSSYEYKNDMDANMATLLLGELPKG